MVSVIMASVPLWQVYHYGKCDVMASVIMASVLMASVIMASVIMASVIMATVLWQL